ncbi:hypothetical protein CEUSTIGMA_g9704.t1 [Chlamydomonas eustigma]|uniref:OCEL domain-containing protein n=1 Tax=Chlamydomonas eustigma TaxID=1157962 RepID=A0A250XGR8_9CHLO|nr:hypothetical protein CEUSTIGMA_g9704.t1 [Chlamydomonas eustigma]|eukprot:GAX82275.1 hypothetical protein CEUSTIGMA_g9704.t1 [Chlamydomonas eustigma]
MSTFKFQEHQNVCVQMRLSPQLRVALLAAQENHQPISLKQDNSKAVLTIGEDEYVFTVTEEGNCDAVQLPSPSSYHSGYSEVGPVKHKLGLQKTLDADLKNRVRALGVEAQPNQRQAVMLNDRRMLGKGKVTKTVTRTVTPPPPAVQTAANAVQRPLAPPPAPKMVTAAAVREPPKPMSTSGSIGRLSRGSTPLPTNTSSILGGTSLSPPSITAAAAAASKQLTPDVPQAAVLAAAKGDAQLCMVAIMMSQSTMASSMLLTMMTRAYAAAKQKPEAKEYIQRLVQAACELVRPSNKLRLKQRVVEEDGPKVQALLNPQNHNRGQGAQADEVRGAMRVPTSVNNGQDATQLQKPADNVKKRKCIAAGDKITPQNTNAVRSYPGSHMHCHESDFKDLEETPSKGVKSYSRASVVAANASSRHLSTRSEDLLEEAGLVPVRDTLLEDSGGGLVHTGRLGYAHMVREMMQQQQQPDVPYCRSSGDGMECDEGSRDRDVSPEAEVVEDDAPSEKYVKRHKATNICPGRGDSGLEKLMVNGVRSRSQSVEKVQQESTEPRDVSIAVADGTVSASDGTREQVSAADLEDQAYEELEELDQEPLDSDAELFAELEAAGPVVRAPIMSIEDHQRYKEEYKRKYDVYFKVHQKYNQVLRDAEALQQAVETCSDGQKREQWHRQLWRLGAIKMPLVKRWRHVAAFLSQDLEWIQSEVRSFLGRLQQGLQSCS